MALEPWTWDIFLTCARRSKIPSGSAVLSAKAQLEEAQLNPGFTRITSPIDGIASIANGQIGESSVRSAMFIARAYRSAPSSVRSAMFGSAAGHRSDAAPDGP